MTRCLSLALITLLMLKAAQAGVTVETSAQAPSQDIALSFVVPDAGAIGYQWRNTVDHGRRDLGQTFIPKENLSLKQVTVQLQSGSGVGAKDAPFQLSIFELNGKAKGRTLASVEGSLPKEISPANTYLSFRFSDEDIQLKAGAAYGFLLIFEEQAESRAISLQSVNVNADQPNIQRIESTNGEKLTVSKAALEFYLQSTEREK